MFVCTWLQYMKAELVCISDVRYDFNVWVVCAKYEEVYFRTILWYWYCVMIDCKVCAFVNYMNCGANYITCIKVV